VAKSVTKKRGGGSDSPRQEKEKKKFLKKKDTVPTPAKGVTREEPSVSAFSSPKKETETPSLSAGPRKRRGGGGHRGGFGAGEKEGGHIQWEAPSNTVHFAEGGVKIS